MTTPERRTPTGFTEPVTTHAGKERRQYDAFVPSPLPPPNIDISPSSYREFDDNVHALAELATSNPHSAYPATRLARVHEAAASCNIENISVTPYDILKAPQYSQSPRLAYPAASTAFTPPTSFARLPSPWTPSTQPTARWYPTTPAIRLPTLSSTASHKYSSPLTAASCIAWLR